MKSLLAGFFIFLLCLSAQAQSIFASGSFASIVTPGGVSGGGGGAPGDGYEANLFAYYKCDDADGTTGLSDSLGSHNLPYSSGPNSSVSGIIGSAFEVSLLSWSESTSAFHFASHSFTLRFWFKANFGSFNYPLIGDNAVVWEIYFGSPPSGFDDKVDFQLDPAVGANTDLVSSSGVGDGAWHHIVAWWDKIALQAGLTIDNGTPQTLSIPAGLYAPGFNTSFGIGAIGDGDGSHHYTIDEVAFWDDYILTPSDITFDYNSGAGRTYPLP